MKKILLTIWQFPQLIVGYIMLLIIDIDGFELINRKCFYISKKIKGGISLGKVVIINSMLKGERKEKAIMHEYGHSRQSEILGWLYLPVIGLPSLLHAIYYRIFKYGDYKDYYNFYTEKWADKLGGVTR